MGTEQRQGNGRRAGRHSRPGSFRRTVARRVGLAVSLVAVVAGVGIGVHIGWFYWRSHTVGSALIRNEQAAIAGASRAGAASTCSSAGSSPSGTAAATAPAPNGTPAPIGILEAPAIGLRAPVVEGVGNAELNVAVGHVPASVLPGQIGTAVLSAHDVSWFSRINHLHPGATVSFVEPCRTFRYRVVRGAVVRSGSPIYSTLVPELALVTCYPLNALFLTPDRYVLTAELVGVTDTARSMSGTSTPAVLPPPLVVPAPAALEAQGLTLATNDAPLGTLDFQGDPSAAVQESPVPMQVEASVLELYFAAVLSAEQDRPTWWSVLAPSVPFADAGPLVGATIERNDASVVPTLDIDGASFTGASVSAEPELVGGGAPGVYHLTMRTVVHGETLVVTGWQLERIGG